MHPISARELSKALRSLLNFSAAASAAFASAASASWAAPAPVLEIDRVEQTTVHFKPGADGKTLKPLDTKLQELRVLGSLPSDPIPYLVLAGRPCNNCSVEKAVHLIRADGGKSTHFVYPGRIIDTKDRKLVLDSRAFYGRCLGGAFEGANVYVAFQKERVDRRKQLQSSVYIGTPGKEHLEEHLLERRLPKIATTLQRVKAKQCFEIEGRNRMTSNLLIDLRARRDDAENDADDEPKESQTGAELPAAQE